MENIRNLFSDTFLDELLRKVSSYKEITGTTIKEIVYGEGYKGYVSTAEVCRYVGIEIKEKHNDKDNYGGIRVENDSIIIEYCNQQDKEERRRIRAHEIGHIFKHLIGDINVVSANKLYLARSAKEESESVDKQQEAEADIFADELIY